MEENLRGVELGVYSYAVGCCCGGGCCCSSLDTSSYVEIGLLVAVIINFGCNMLWWLLL
jgi:hypothetical protein